MEIADIPILRRGPRSRLFTSYRERIAALIFRRDWSNIICWFLARYNSARILRGVEFKEFLDTATTCFHQVRWRLVGNGEIMKSRIRCNR